MSNIDYHCTRYTMSISNQTNVNATIVLGRLWRLVSITNKFRHVHIVKRSLWVKSKLINSKVFIGFWNWILLYPPRNMWISSSPIRRSQKATWHQIRRRRIYVKTQKKVITSSNIPPAKPLCPVPSPSSALVSWQPIIIVGGLSPIGSCQYNGYVGRWVVTR